jgi:hypothetical protein
MGKHVNPLVNRDQLLGFQTQYYKHANPKGRSKAGSKLSMRLVAKITFTSAHASNPSNWFNNSSIVLWISRSPPECASYLPSSAGTSKTHSTTHPSSLNYQKCTCGRRTALFYPMLCKRKTYLFVPTASISSIKTMDGESSSATWKSSHTNLGPSPKYFCISSLPTTRKNVVDVEFATACSKFQPQVLLLDCTSCIGGNYNPKQQNPSILSSLSCTHKVHLGVLNLITHTKTVFLISTPPTSLTKRTVW